MRVARRGCVAMTVIQGFWDVRNALALSLRLRSAAHRDSECESASLGRQLMGQQPIVLLFDHCVTLARALLEGISVQNENAARFVVD